MRVPFNDLKRQFHSQEDEIRQAVCRVAESGWYLIGPELAAFESEFAAFCGRKHVTGVASGTDALEIALRALGCGPGDEVVTVANAGGYATAAILMVGATPVYVDVDEATLTMSPLSLSQALSSATKSVVVTHLYGQLAAMDAILEALSGSSACVLEDCAQAHGASRNGISAGAFGAIATFSFYPTKNLGALGDAGAIVTDDDALADRVRLLRQYGWRQKYHSEIPFARNSRMDEVQAAVLRTKLPQLNANNEKRREIANRYSESCRGGTVHVVHQEHETDYVGHLCVTRCSARDNLREFLKEHDVATDVHYPVLDPDQLAMRNLNYRSTPLTISQRASEEVLSLPCFPELQEEEVAWVCECLRNYSERHNGR